MDAMHVLFLHLLKQILLRKFEIVVKTAIEISERRLNDLVCLFRPIGVSALT